MPAGPGESDHIHESQRVTPSPGRGDIPGVPIVPLHGHAPLRRRLLDAAARDALPASLLFQGPRGVGKQRLALWLGQALLCEGAMDDRPGGEPCARCRHCRYTVELTHPDLHWYFPRPRPKDADQTPAEVQADYAAARAERMERHGLYAPASAPSWATIRSASPTTNTLRRARAGETAADWTIARTVATNSASIPDAGA